MKEQMKYIDQMLDQWIYNDIIRGRLRKLITKAIENANNETPKK